MKKIILLSVLLLSIISSPTNAQTYNINKLNYDVHLYYPQFGDPYNPALSGVCSFFLPGLGQMFCDETGRGLAFLGAYAGCGLVGFVGYGVAIGSIYRGYNPASGFGLMLVGFGSMAAVSIWSIVDAVNVAKVNDMYIQNLRKASTLKFEFSPYIDQIAINNQIATPVGLTMRIRF